MIRDQSAPLGMVEKFSGTAQVWVSVKWWYLLSNRPVCICNVLPFSESLCESGANSKLLLCSISELQLNYRGTKCYFRCVLCVFLVYILTLVPCFLFFVFSFLLWGWTLTLRKYLDTASLLSKVASSYLSADSIQHSLLSIQSPYCLKELFRGSYSFSVKAYHSHPEKYLIQPKSFLMMGSLRQGV